MYMRMSEHFWVLCFELRLQGEDSLKLRYFFGGIFVSDTKYAAMYLVNSLVQTSSEQRLYERLRAMHDPMDPRQLVLAYGSWGAVAGRAGSAANRGNAPCIGVGLMNKLAKRFLVALTPEQYTSKTCCRCLHPCGPWAELEDKMGRKIRGCAFAKTKSAVSRKTAIARVLPTPGFNSVVCTGARAQYGR